MSGGDWLRLCLLSLLWGGSFFFNELALLEVRPFTLVLCRVGIAALCLHLLVQARGLRLPSSPRLWAGFALLAVLNNLLPFSLIAWGQTRIDSGLASILNATTPLFGVLLAHRLTTDERLSANRLAGVLLGVAGVALIMGPSSLRLDGSLLGKLAILGAAFCYALSTIFGRRFGGIPPLLIATGQVTMTSVMMLPLVLAIDRPWQLPPPGLTTIGALLALGVVATALAYLLFFRILTTAGATNLMLVTFLVPVSALLLGSLLLGEQLGLNDAAGMGLIALGLAAVDGRPLAALRRRTAASLG